MSGGLNKEILSARELLELRNRRGGELMGLFPGTTEGMSKKAKREGWKFRHRIGRGGGREYYLASLPAKLKDAMGYRDREKTASDEEPMIRRFRAIAKALSGHPNVAEILTEIGVRILREGSERR